MTAANGRGTWLRATMAARLDRALERRSRALDDGELARRTLVLSPHPDDETLGCGGTIARIRATGSPVTVVVATDGHRSHRHLMPEQQLRERRAAEVRAACSALGVESTAVHLLGHRDGELRSNHSEATRAVLDLLQSRDIERLLVPFRADHIADHLAAHDIGVAAAAAVGGRVVEILEYPIWFWNVWPFVSPEDCGIGDRLRAPCRFLATRRLLVQLERFVELGPALAIKQRALAEHATQLTRVVDDPRWATLKDVSHGDWLARLLGPREYFARHVPAASKLP